MSILQHWIIIGYINRCDSTINIVLYTVLTLFSYFLSHYVSFMFCLVLEDRLYHSFILFD